MDGIGPFAPTRAFCRKGRTPQDTITQINTTIQYDINVINPTGRKSIPVTYLGNEGSIRQIRLHFKSCRQFIRYRCARSALFNSPEGPKMVRTRYVQKHIDRYRYVYSFLITPLRMHNE